MIKNQAKDLFFLAGTLKSCKKAGDRLFSPNQTKDLFFAFTQKAHKNEILMGSTFNNF